MTGNPRAAALLMAGGLLAGSAAAQVRHPPVNPDSAIVQDFEKRISDYARLRSRAEEGLQRLQPTASQDKISRRADTLAAAIREIRKDAKQGDVFTPPVAGEMRRLIAMAMQEGGAKRVRQSLRHAEPVRLNLKVNDSYPPRVPLQSTPPSLLGNLPKLPPDIEYRIVGSDLILLDTRANLVVDLLHRAF